MAEYYYQGIRKIFTEHSIVVLKRVSLLPDHRVNRECTRNILLFFSDFNDLLKKLHSLSSLYLKCKSSLLLSFLLRIIIHDKNSNDIL